jgi:hypothetical protein
VRTRNSVGERAGERAGESAASAGDVNGDGLADMIVGAADKLWDASPNHEYGNRPGGAYVVPRSVSGHVDPSTRRRSSGSHRTSGYAGSAVSGVGDEDGDGFTTSSSALGDRALWRRGAQFLRRAILIHAADYRCRNGVTAAFGGTMRTAPLPRHIVLLVSRAADAADRRHRPAQPMPRSSENRLTMRGRACPAPAT